MKNFETFVFLMAVVTGLILLIINYDKNTSVVDILPDFCHTVSCLFCAPFLSIYISIKIYNIFNRDSES
jgi:hypothetical protein